MFEYNCIILFITRSKAMSIFVTKECNNVRSFQGQKSSYSSVPSVAGF